ncbi:hypothetical protein CANINC_001936 [Pichia inconspicua]|uniref:J domain-containing protein n=1 Tax=Pichia inconspicua TaxID=52247 RepID=A0A4T0X2E8_9ASCO|nr:hypothetical protein CANINC_001936 [[Candida] inconspicua]
MTFVMRRFMHGTAVVQRETHYDILKLPHDSSTADIKSRFKKISLKLHPDMLKSQGLNEVELDKRAEEYLKVKKSYEVLTDTAKRAEYDVKMGIRRRGSGDSNSNSVYGNGFMREAGTTQHFHAASRHRNDVPHFDWEKHQERNERVEKRFMYNQKMSQNVDLFGKDLYSRNLGNKGPRKGIYRDYGRPRSVHEQEIEGRQIAIKVGGTVVTLLVLWWILCSGFSTKKKEEVVGKREFDGRKVEVTSDEKNRVSRTGSTMSVNNRYGMMLIKRDGDLKPELEGHTDMDVFEEQISETAE